MPIAPNSTYLQVAELWRKDPQTEELHHAGGYYSTHANFCEVSRAIAFPLGQGMIGRCAQRRAPLLLDELAPDTGFLRAAAARAAGLTVGLALPVDSIAGQPGVLSLFFSHQRDQPSAGVEVWAEDDGTSLIGLRLAHHGIAEDFRRVSAQSRFRPGQGLPGRLIDRSKPELLDRLDRPRTFLRAMAAETAGFVQAIGFPTGGTLRSAIVLLGHAQQPVVERAEVWRSMNGSGFELVSSQSRTTTPVPVIDRSPWLQRAKDLHAPVVFAAAESGQNPDHSARGGLILPYFSTGDGITACVLTW